MGVMDHNDPIGEQTDGGGREERRKRKRKEKKHTWNRASNLAVDTIIAL